MAPLRLFACVWGLVQCRGHDAADWLAVAVVARCRCDDSVACVQIRMVSAWDKLDDESILVLEARPSVVWFGVEDETESA